MTSKQINIKKELAERLKIDEDGTNQTISYSKAIEELFKIKEENDIRRKLELGFNRKKTKRRTGLAYNGAAEEG